MVVWKLAVILCTVLEIKDQGLEIVYLVVIAGNKGTRAGRVCGPTAPADEIRKLRR